MRRLSVAVTVVLLGSLIVLAQTQPRIDPRRPEKRSLKPTPEARAKYAEFLKSRNTGLFVLLPREKYDPQINGRTIVSRIPGDAPPTLSTFPRTTFESTVSTSEFMAPHDQVTAAVPGSTSGGFSHLNDIQRSGAVANARKSGNVRGGGAYYSFTRKTHEYGYGTHLSLEHGQFLVGFAGADYGALVNLGDVPLESVSLNTPAAKLLETYRRASRERDARSEDRRFGKGVVVDGLTFRRSLPKKPNSTYVLRAVNYGNSDVLVAFRVVEVEFDGAALILWKLLKRYPTPQIER